MSNTLAVFNTMSKTLSDSDLREAISILISERKARDGDKALKNRHLLMRGDRVQWTGRKSGSCTGIVTKVKRKKAIVTEDQLRMSWDIPMSMLTKIS